MTLEASLEFDIDLNLFSFALFNLLAFGDFDRVKVEVTWNSSSEAGNSN